MNAGLLWVPGRMIPGVELQGLRSPATPIQGEPTAWRTELTVR